MDELTLIQVKEALTLAKQQIEHLQTMLNFERGEKENLYSTNVTLNSINRAMELLNKN